MLDYKRKTILIVIVSYLISKLPVVIAVQQDALQKLMILLFVIYLVIFFYFENFKTFLYMAVFSIFLIGNIYLINPLKKYEDYNTNGISMSVYEFGNNPNYYKIVLIFGMINAVVTGLAISFVSGNWKLNKRIKIEKK
jgi:hypothetical protein